MIIHVYILFWTLSILAYGLKYMFPSFFKPLMAYGKFTEDLNRQEQNERPSQTNENAHVISSNAAQPSSSIRNRSPDLGAEGKGKLYHPDEEDIDIARDSGTASSAYVPRSADLRAPAWLYVVSLNQIASWRMFYFVAILVNTLQITMFVILFHKSNASYQLYIPYVLMEMHLTRRFMECLTVHKMSSRQLPVHLVLFGLQYYGMAVTGISVDLLSKGTEYVGIHGDVGVPDIPIFVVLLGILMFLAASLLQAVSHLELTHVPPVHPQISKYGIPLHGTFRYLVCPHYLAEILIYLSFVLVRKGPMMCLLFNTLFVIVNRIDAALETEKWYLDTFEEKYTKRMAKYAIIPYFI